jgi:hypothetical protein
VVLVVGCFATFFSTDVWNHMKDFLGIIWSGLIALVSTALGHYFGKAKSGSTQRGEATVDPPPRQ